MFNPDFFIPKHFCIFATMIVYLISYYNRNLCYREYYMNRSSFESFERAEREVELLKKHEKWLKKHGHDSVRNRFKIEPKEIKPKNIAI